MKNGAVTGGIYMEENYTKILWDGFGLRFYGGMRTRTGFLSKTDQGLKEIKKTQRRKEEIVFEHAAKEHLYKNNVKNISRFYLGVTGEPYFTVEDTHYLVENVVTSQPLEENDKNVFPKATKMLAQIHKGSAHFNCEYSKSNLGVLSDRYHRRRNELQRIKKGIDKKTSYNDLDLMVKQNFQYYLERTERAISCLKSAGYQEEIKRAEGEKSICHNTYKGENIRTLESGELYITGFHQCAYDTPLVDLAAYLRRFLKKTDGDSKVAEEMIHAYDSIRNISKQDLQIVLGILTYPEKFMRLCNEYYNKRRVCISPAVKERMESCIAERKKQDIFLQEFEQWI